MRGTLKSPILLHASSYGLIPAGAGNMLPGSRSRTNTRAHPRGCGEHTVSDVLCGHFKGSSPRVRGTSGSFSYSIHPHGLIPAGAGNIIKNEGSPSCHGAHPRGCGEHVVIDEMVYVLLGSSPRVRGTSKSLTQPNQPKGLIPAGAGNILSDMGFYPHTSSFSISLKPITYFQEYTICSYLRREARLYRLALLHPFRGTNPFFGVDGRIISLTPSKSTGSHG